MSNRIKKEKKENEQLKFAGGCLLDKNNLRNTTTAKKINIKEEESPYEKTTTASLIDGGTL